MEENNTEKVYTKAEVESIVEQINKQARTQCENLYKRCQYLEEQLLYKRLDYLFKVISNYTMFSESFYENCVKEIETIMTPPKVEDEKSEE